MKANIHMQNTENAINYKTWFDFHNKQALILSPQEKATLGTIFAARLFHNAVQNAGDNITNYSIADLIPTSKPSLVNVRLRMKVL